MRIGEKCKDLYKKGCSLFGNNLVVMVRLLNLNLDRSFDLFFFESNGKDAVL